MFWIILLVLFLLFLSWVLFTPVVFKASTDEHILGVKIQGLGGVRVVWEGDQLPKAKWRLWWWERDIKFTEKPSEKKEEKPTKEKAPAKRKRKRIGPKMTFMKVIRILRSFKVRKFRINLDTDDYIFNAYLYPLFAVLDHGRGHLQVNYEGRVDVDVEITNRAAWVLWAFLRR
jgi:hypothetical protein